MMTVTVKKIALWKRVLLWKGSEKGRRRRYVLLCVLCVSGIWVPTIAYLKMSTPSYTSKWTLNLPGTGVSSSVNLDSIGTASTSSVSAYGSHTINPSTNYKQIAESVGVLELASKKMGMTKEEFGAPRISVVDQTTMIFFEMKGRSGIEAQKKSYAFYYALEDILNELREDEIARREKSIRKVLFNSKEKLREARNSLLGYQAKTRIISTEQFNEFAMSFDKAKLKLYDLKLDQSGIEGELMELQSKLKLDVQSASDAMGLQSDPVFLENSKRHAEVGALLAKQLLKMGKDHPDVIKSRNEVVAAEEKMKAQIEKLIDKKDPDLIKRILLSTQNERGVLFEKMITLAIQKKGNADKISKLEAQIADMNNQLDNGMKSAAVLDDLMRDHQIAEAVFSSALARVDTGKSDIYASYPLIQILAHPSAPKNQTSPNKLFVTAGALGGTIFSMAGVSILWIRKKLLHKILLNE